MCNNKGRKPSNVGRDRTLSDASEALRQKNTQIQTAQRVMNAVNTVNVAPLRNMSDKAEGFHRVTQLMNLVAPVAMRINDVRRRTLSDMSENPYLKHSFTQGAPFEVGTPTQSPLGTPFSEALKGGMEASVDMMRSNKLQTLDTIGKISKAASRAGGGFMHGIGRMGSGEAPGDDMF